MSLAVKRRLRVTYVVEVTTDSDAVLQHEVKEVMELFLAEPDTTGGKNRATYKHESGRSYACETFFANEYFDAAGNRVAL